MAMVQKYQKRISGPLLDRIEIHLEVPCVPMQMLSSIDGANHLPQSASAWRKLTPCCTCVLRLSTSPSRRAVAVPPAGYYIMDMNGLGSVLDREAGHYHPDQSSPQRCFRDVEHDEFLCQAGHAIE